MKNSKLLILTLLLVGGISTVQAQVKIGDNPTTILAGSLLELESTTKALTLPRLSSGQMAAIPSPTDGMFIYNTDEKCVFQHNEGSWTSLCQPGDTFAYRGTGAPVAGTTAGAADPNDLYVDSGTGITYQWDGTAWHKIAVDHDWYTYGATDADPQSIADNIWTYGSVSFGNSTGTNTGASYAGGARSMAGGFNTVTDVLAANSAAFGNTNFTSGVNSLVFGELDTATGAGSIVGGYHNTANGAQSLTVGSSNYNGYNFSIVGGKDNYCLSALSIVTGSQNDVRSHYGITAGLLNTVGLNQAPMCIVAGESNTVSGNRSIVAGQDNTVSATTSASAVWGQQNTVSGAFGSVWGTLNTASGNYASVAGQNNELTNQAHASSVWGDANKSQSDNTGLWGFQNEIFLNADNSAVWGEDNEVRGKNSLVSGQDCIVAAGNSNSVAIGNSAVTTTVNQFRGRFNGGIYFHSSAANAALGAKIATGQSAWSAISDRRAKENITAVGYGLNTVMKLNPRSYNYLGNNFRNLGFIAQDVAEIVPEVVDVPENADEMYSIRYSELIPVLTKAIQEQQAQIEELKAEVKALKNNK